MSEQTSVKAIVEFTNKYDFLHNHFMLTNLSPIIFSEYEFWSVQHAFEASKTQDMMARKRISKASSPRIATMLSRFSSKTSNWDDSKLQIMTDLVYQKFIRNDKLAWKLIHTGELPLIYGNIENDTFWGATLNSERVWVGENHLGKLLMELRNGLTQAVKDKAGN